MLGDLDEDSDSEAEDEDPALGAMGRARRQGKKNAFAPGEVTVGPGLADIARHIIKRV